jgi:hypothetical protein
MNFTNEQINHLADVYANGKSSSDVFREQHKTDFIAGFEKALSLFAVIGSACDCTCSNAITYENCDKKCKGYELEQADL